jgi:hypothetical protein
VMVTFSYYVNVDLFCLMMIPSNCKIWRTNAVDAYETARKRIKMSTVPVHSGSSQLFLCHILWTDFKKKLPLLTD